MIFAAILVAAAQSASSVPAVWTESRGGITVSSGDYTQCPYETVAQIKKVVRPDFLWSKGPDRAEAISLVAAEAQTLGADGVVFVTIGKPHISLTKVNAVTIRGRAIRFTDRACNPNVSTTRTSGPLVVAPD
jgi:hypothetical protein